MSSGYPEFKISVIFWVFDILIKLTIQFSDNQLNYNRWLPGLPKGSRVRKYLSQHFEPELNGHLSVRLHFFQLLIGPP